MNAPPSIDAGAVNPPVPFEARRAARSLYWRGWSITQIADELGLKYSTVASWKSRHQWDAAPSHAKIADAVEPRLATLIAKDDKTGKDFKEIDLLMRQVERLARIEKYGESGREADLNPKAANRHSPETS